MSPSNFNTGALAANDFYLNSAGYITNTSVWNGNGVRASFLLRLANANALRVNGYDYWWEEVARNSNRKIGNKIIPEQKLK